MLNLIPSDMGNRIHVQIKREIEYGDYGFNWQIEELMSLLSDCGCEVYGSLNAMMCGRLEILKSNSKMRWETSQESAKKSRILRLGFIGRASDEEFKDDVVSNFGDSEKGDLGMDFTTSAGFDD